MIDTHQTEQPQGTPIRFIKYDRELRLSRFVGMAEMQSIRRQYMKLQSQKKSRIDVDKEKQNAERTEEEIGASFIEFFGTYLR